MERELRNKLRNGRFAGTPPQRSRTMRAIKGQNNRTTELRLRLALARSRIKGWTLRPKTILGNPDFWFAEERVAVFVDGCFWHGCPACNHAPKVNSAYWRAKFERNAARDSSITQKLRSEGIEVVRFWEHELTDNLQECVERLARVISEL
jgi:DNA mismatch endonuclease Vsr